MDTLGNIQHNDPNKGHYIPQENLSSVDEVGTSSNYYIPGNTVAYCL